VEGRLGLDVEHVGSRQLLDILVAGEAGIVKILPRSALFHRAFGRYGPRNHKYGSDQEQQTKNTRTCFDHQFPPHFSMYPDQQSRLKNI